MNSNQATLNNNVRTNSSIIKIILGFIILAAIAIVGLQFFARNKTVVVAQETVTVGAILPLTGKFADYGSSVRAGLEIAAREINSTGKINYKIVYYDTQSDVKKALTGYSRQKSIDKINIFITAAGDHALALKSVAINDGSLLFCFAPHSNITKNNGQLVFRFFCAGSDEGDCLLRYITDSLSEKRIFLYSMNAESGIEFSNHFKTRLGPNLIGTCFYDEDVSTLRNITTTKTYKEADCIAIFGGTPAIGFIVRSLREAGYSGSIIINGAFNQPSVIAAAGDYAKTVSYVAYTFPYQSNQHKVWNDESLTLYGTSFSHVSYFAYGALHILNEINLSKIYSPQEIGKLLSEAKTYKVKVGEDILNFPSKDGGIVVPMRMETISGNK